MCIRFYLTLALRPSDFTSRAWNRFHRASRGFLLSTSRSLARAFASELVPANFRFCCGWQRRSGWFGLIRTLRSQPASQSSGCRRAHVSSGSRRASGTRLISFGSSLSTSYRKSHLNLRKYEARTQGWGEHSILDDIIRGYYDPSAFIFQVWYLKIHPYTKYFWSFRYGLLICITK